MIRKWIAAIAAGLLLVSCSSNPAETITEAMLITGAVTKLETADSMDVSMSMKTAVTAGSVTMPALNTTYNVQYTSSPTMTHGVLSADDFAVLGSIETYTVRQDRTYTIYTKVGPVWTKTVKEMADKQDDVPLWRILNSVVKYADKMTLNEEAVFEEKECYEISGTLPGDELTPVVKPYLEQLDTVSEDFKLPDTPLSVFFDKETLDPVGAEFSVGIADAEVMGFTGDITMDVHVVCKGFDTIDQITIPEEALKAQ